MNKLQCCRTCGHSCGVDRTLITPQDLGVCKTGEEAMVSTAYAHFGEEPVIKGLRGSGAVFFSRCNMGCLYCQNAEISARDAGGRVLRVEELGALFLDLATQGVHNINWVSPSHVVPQALGALAYAAERGLTLPVVYNTGGYDHFDTLRALDGIVDIYLPDIKTMNERHARMVLKAPGYPDIALITLEEMVRQVGLNWTMNPDGTLSRGLLVRHLVLPQGEGDSIEVLEVLMEEFGPELPLHLMAQYKPMTRPYAESDHLNEDLQPETFMAVLMAARKMGFKHLIGVQTAA